MGVMSSLAASPGRVPGCGRQQGVCVCAYVVVELCVSAAVCVGLRACMFVVCVCARMCIPPSVCVMSARVTSTNTRAHIHTQT